MPLTANVVAERALRIWLPTIRARSGADVFTIRLAEALRRAGHVPLLQWFDHRYEFMPHLLKRVQAPSGTDVVHAGSWQGFAFKRKNIPLVVTEHHYVLDPAFRPYKSHSQHIYHSLLIDRYIRESFKVADAIATVSAFTARVLKSQLNLKAAKVIPLWADYGVFSPASNFLGLREQDKFCLLFVGNASKRKGADLIQPLSRMLGRDFEIRCTSGLRAHADERSSMHSNIVSLGRLSVDQLVKEYQNCSAVLVPSRYEGFGYAALEGMACGKPIIGFRCGAVDEVVAHGETGFLCNIDDLDALASFCKQLQADRELVEKLGAAARKRVIMHYSEQVGVNAYLDLYKSLLS